MVTFNAVDAEHSQQYAYKCWYNYNYEKNTMRISEEDMQKINEQYEGKISQWQATAEKDNNTYEISDESFTTSGLGLVGNEKQKVSTQHAKGWNDAAEKTGVSGDTTGQTVQAAADLAMGGIGVFVAAAPISLAVGALYMATKPNKDEAAALAQLKDDMENYQSSIESSQNNLMQMLMDNVDLEAVAQKTSENFEQTIEEKQAEYEQYMAVYEEIMSRVESGEPIGEDDKKLLELVGKNLQVLGAEIAELREDSQDEVGEVYDSIAETQEDYENTSDSLEYMQGTTDFAESFDEATKALATTEAVAQALNATNGLVVGAALTAAGCTPFTFWLLAFGAMGLAGGTMSTIATVEQSKISHEVGKEIDVRNNTQELLSESFTVYEDSYDGFDTALSSVEDIVFEAPDELFNPDSFILPDLTTGGENNEENSSNPFAVATASNNSGVSNNPFVSSSTPVQDDDKKNPFA